MSFLNQLKSQANALQSQQGQAQLDLEENTAQTEEACRFALQYLHDLARHLKLAGGAIRLRHRNPCDEPAELIVGEPHRFA